MFSIFCCKIKKWLPIVLAVPLLLLFTACSDSKTEIKYLRAIDMLDNETGQIYSLGMSKNVFDTAFNSMEIVEKDNNTTSYLGGLLSIEFDDGLAKLIQCSAGTDRFSFYKFDFSIGIDDIKNYYFKQEADDDPFISYLWFYDDKGQNVEPEDSVMCSWLTTNKDDNLVWRKDQYIYYSIASLDSNNKPTEPEEELTGNVFFDAKSGRHSEGRLTNGYSLVKQSEAQKASMDDFVDFAFNHVQLYEHNYNWYTIVFTDDNGKKNGKGICFYGCNPYTVEYGKILEQDSSIYESIGMLIYNEETSSYEYEPMPEEE